MKLSQEAIDNLLHIIADFDRERGVPHDYLDLEYKLREVEVEVRDNKICFINQKDS